MTETSAASASAHDATAFASYTVGQLEDALAAKRAEDEAAFPARRLAGLQSRRAKLAEQLKYLDADIAAAEKEV